MNRSHNTRSWLGFLLIALALCLTGCSGGSVVQPPGASYPTSTPFISPRSPEADIPTVDAPATTAPSFGATGTMVSKASAFEDIPLYPAARQVHLDSSKAPQIQMSSYVTSAQFSDVQAFYITHLVGKGWQVEDKNGTGISFSWKHASGEIPWRLLFTATFFQADAATLEVSTLLSRWPDSNRVPMYEGATDIRVSNETATDGYTDRVISYSVAAPVVDVTSFYTSALSQYGWHQDALHVESDKAKGDYYYAHGSIAGPVGGSVIFILRAVKGNSTSIELHIRGSDLEPLTPSPR